MRGWLMEDIPMAIGFTGFAELREAVKGLATDCFAVRDAIVSGGQRFFERTLSWHTFHFPHCPRPQAQKPESPDFVRILPPPDEAGRISPSGPHGRSQAAGKAV